MLTFKFTFKMARAFKNVGLACIKLLKLIYLKILFVICTHVPIIISVPSNKLTPLYSLL